MAIDRASRNSVRSAYQNWYKPAIAVPIGWEGKISTCRAGGPSTAAQNATLDMVNYFREMNDLDPVRFDPAYSAKAQHAALIMEANRALSHNPPNTWDCWSQSGSEGAGHSNLALGASGASAIDLYMRDPGSNNLQVGHRRWVTSADRTTMGSGSTPSANALYVLGDADPNAHVPAMVAWPSPGYFPAPLDPAGRWSLNIMNESSLGSNPFANATVTVRESATGKALRTRVVDRGSVRFGMGEAIVFEVDGTRLPPRNMDKAFRVTVEGISHPSFPPSYTYYVTMFDPETLTPPTANPPIPVYGSVETIKVSGRRVSFYGMATALEGPATVVISRDGRTLGTLVATRPRSDGFKGFLYEQTVTPGTYTYCAHFAKLTPPGGFMTDCRKVVVK